jgi:hypothetical protein
MPTNCTWDEGPANLPEPAPLSTELRHHTAYPAESKAGSHLGSTLNPGGAVLTLGVSRRSRSVAYIRADASLSEVHAKVMVAPGARRVNPTASQLQQSTRLTRRPRSRSAPLRGMRLDRVTHAKRFQSSGGRWPWHYGHVESISRSTAEVASGRARSRNPRQTGHACRVLREGGAGPAASRERRTRMVLHLGDRRPALGHGQTSDESPSSHPRRNQALVNPRHAC